MLDLLSPTLWAICISVTLVAGFIKGAVGFALPLIMVSGMSTVIDPRLAVAGLVIPTVASNLAQVARAGRAEALSAARDFRYYIIPACLMVFLVAQFLSQIPPRAFYFAIGVPVLILSLVQLAGLRFSVPPERRGLWDPLVGAFAGTIGGIAGNWGPPTVLYLLALGVDRTRQMATQGVVYALGSVTLLIGHTSSGILNRETLPFSLALLVPAGLGMWLGFRFGERLDAEKFRSVTLVVLVLAGANLLRRGLFG